MANQEHVKRLMQRGDSWNQWRAKNISIQPDLVGADLRGANLSEADLYGANLSGAHLYGTNLSGADLSGAHLDKADLRSADLYGTDLREVNLRGADLRGADLRGADLSEAHLNEADLRRADLRRANLSGVDLHRADLSGTTLWKTILTKIDLRTTKGLSAIKHDGPSFIELFNVQLPQDGSILPFLRGVGVPDEWIDFWRTTMMQPIQYHSCFISYASEDRLLASRLHADLQAQGVRCWFAPEDMKIGDKIRQRIDEAIHVQDKLLLLLSKYSIASAWVRDEVEAAFEKERKQERDILFPIRLDAAVMQTEQSWAATLRRTRHIGDFSKWTDPQKYQGAFTRLLRDLKQR